MKSASLSRRSILGSIPMMGLSAPTIAMNFPTPLPVVSEFLPGMKSVPFEVWRKNPDMNPKVLSKIWRTWDRIARDLQAPISSSKVEQMMTDVVEEVSGYKPPFLIECEGIIGFIFHPVTRYPDNPNYPIYPHVPIYHVEWTKIFLAKILQIDINQVTDPMTHEYMSPGIWSSVDIISPG